MIAPPPDGFQWSVADIKKLRSGRAEVKEIKMEDDGCVLQGWKMYSDGRRISCPGVD
jgi:hypothetical protein